MSVTPQTNASLRDIAQALRVHDDYLIVGHVSPDGDCIGSQLALMHALRRMGKRARCAFASDASSLDASLSFLPGVSDISAASKVQHAASVIAVDVPTRKRMGQTIAALQEAAQFTVTVDHHATEETPSQLRYIDPDAASTTTLIWDLARELGVSREGDVATCAFTGLVTDTGRFQYQNANAQAFRCAAEMVEQGVDVEAVCGQLFQRKTHASLLLESQAATRMELLLDGRLAMTYVSLDDLEQAHACKTDADGVVNVLRSLDGVRVACVLREAVADDGQTVQVRGNLRSKDGTDVSAFARAHDGGGHSAASGMTLSGDLPLVYNDIKEELSGYLSAFWKER